MEFSRQEYWSGVPLPSPGDLPNPGIEPRSPALQADTLPFEPPVTFLRQVYVIFILPQKFLRGHFSDFYSCCKYRIDAAQCVHKRINESWEENITSLIFFIHFFISVFMLSDI